MDIDVLKPTVWSQLGACIDMLESAIGECPPLLWDDQDRTPSFPRTAYHALYHLDRHFSEAPDPFSPLPQFRSCEMPEGPGLPPDAAAASERPCTREQLLAYAAHCRERCIARLESLTDETALERCGIGRLNMTVIELVLYAMRHAQHHAGQLSLMVREELDRSVPWIAKSTS